MRHEALTLFPRRIGKIKRIESEKGITIHSLALWEGGSRIYFTTHLNNISVDKNWPQAWPVVPM